MRWQSTSARMQPPSSTSTTASPAGCSSQLWSASLDGFVGNQYVHLPGWWPGVPRGQVSLSICFSLSLCFSLPSFFHSSVGVSVCVSFCVLLFWFSLSLSLLFFPFSSPSFFSLSFSLPSLCVCARVCGPFVCQEHMSRPWLVSWARVSLLVGQGSATWSHVHAQPGSHVH